MYLDLEPCFFWSTKKVDVETYMAECMTCSRVKAQHQKLYKDMEPLPTPMGKWYEITMDIITKFPRMKKSHDMIWFIVHQL